MFERSHGKPKGMDEHDIYATALALTLVRLHVT